MHRRGCRRNLGRLHARVAGEARARPWVRHEEKIALQSLQYVHVSPQGASCRGRLPQELDSPVE